MSNFSMGSMWKSLVKRRSPRLEPADIARIMANQGINVHIDAKGNITALPKDLGGQEAPNLTNRWYDLINDHGPAAANREARFRAYERMDTTGAEGSLILDTYSDEVLEVSNT